MNLNEFEPYNVMERLGYVSTALFPVLRLVCNWTKQHGVHGRKYLLRSPENAISETLIFKMSQDAPALKKRVPLVRRKLDLKGALK